MAHIEPFADRVLLRAVQEDNVTKSGIYLPASASKERPFVYEVIAVGPGKKDVDMGGISVGNQVLCGQYAGDEVKVDNQEYKIVGVDYILAKIS